MARRNVDFSIQQSGIRAGARDLKDLFETEKDFDHRDWERLDRILGRMHRVAHKMVKGVRDWKKGIPPKVYVGRH
jgi:hypothetical protein